MSFSSNNRFAVRLHQLAFPVNGRYPGVAAVRQVLLERFELLSDQQTAGVGLGRNQLHAAVGKIQYLQCTGVFDQPGDVLGDQLFRADQHVDRGMLPGKKLRIVGVGGRANPRHPGRGVEQRVGHLAGDHVDLIRVGHRDDQVGILDACTDQHLGMGGMTVNAADIERILQRLEVRRVHFDHGDVVVLAGQAMGNGGSDLAGAEYDNLHDSWFPISCCVRPFLGQCPVSAACGTGGYAPCQPRLTACRRCHRLYGAGKSGSPAQRPRGPRAGANRK